MKTGKAIKWLLAVLAAVTAVVVATVVVVQEPIPPSGIGSTENNRIYNSEYTNTIAAVRAELDAYRASLLSPSISVAVGIDGALVWADARGYADISTQTMATPDTLYAIGSVSKPITAVLTAILSQNGQLDLDSDVRDYVPEFPKKTHTITLRQLLSHQAGIRHYRFAWSPPIFSESSRNREFVSTDESLALFDNDPLLFEPDTDFEYSTYGYTLVAAAIENVTGQSYIDALRTNVLTPLNLEQTSIDHPEFISGNRATDYVGTFSKKAVLRAPATNSSYKWAGGGLVSTPTDLVLFGNAVLNAALLNDSMRSSMFTARTLPSGEKNPRHYGLGWTIGGLTMANRETGQDEIITLIHHGGTRAGSTSILMIIPDHNVVVAMTSNSVGRGGSGPLASIAAKVARAFIDSLRA
jgi:CubicO group peptidase (beta-lactamase class C family)